MADRYLLESGAPDGYLLEDGSGVLLLEVPATRGLPTEMMSALRVAALLPTILALNEPVQPFPQVDHNEVIRPFRQPAVVMGGMAIMQSGAITLVDDQSGFPRQPDRNQALFELMGTAPAAAAQPQRLWVWNVPPKPPEAEPDYPRAHNNGLHRYRVGFQTVGQSWLTWPKPARAADAPEEYRPPPQPSLFSFENTLPASASQPAFLLFPPARAQLEPDFDIRRTDHWAALTPFRIQPTYGMTAAFGPAQVVLVEPEWPVRSRDRSGDLLLFGRTVTAAPTAGQPFWLWRTPARAVETHEELPRLAAPNLHLYRVGFQTVGQPWLALQPPKPAATLIEDLPRAPSVSLHAFRSPPAARATQPYWLWQPTKRVDTTPEELPRAPAQTLQAFRQQFTFTWAFPEVVTPDIVAEEYTVQPSPQGLLTMFRRAATTPQAGQPWFLWQPKKPASLPEDDLPRQLGFGLHAFRTPPATVQVPQPFWLWRAPARGWLEEETARAAAASLHLYRVGYQTVGQPLWTLQPGKPAQALAEELPRAAGVSLHAFRSPPPAAASAGQPIWLWKTARPLAPDDEPQRAAAISLHAFRASAPVALPGQPWFMWKPAREAMGPELDSQRAQPVTVHPFRWTPIVPPGNSITLYQLSWRSAPHETFEVLDVYPAKHFELLAPFRTAPVTPQPAPCCYRRWFGPTFA